MITSAQTVETAPVHKNLLYRPQMVQFKFMLHSSFIYLGNCVSDLTRFDSWFSLKYQWGVDVEVLKINTENVTDPCHDMSAAIYLKLKPFEKVKKLNKLNLTCVF